jgi:predicted nucleotidyltransferase
MASVDLEDKRREILDIAARHGATNVRVFGSVVRGDDHQSSDIDLLVEMEPGRSLLDLVGLEQDLEALLQRDVDVVTTASVNDAIRDRILAACRPL